MQNFSSFPTKTISFSMLNTLTLGMFFTTLFFTTSCNTVSFEADTTQTTINHERDNIVTSRSLSTTTVSTLLSSGIDEAVCLGNFELCIDQLNAGVINEDDRNAFALLAELYLAKAKQSQEADINEGGCREVVTRPPLDPYYTNAPFTEAQAQAVHEKTQTCRSDYRRYLLNAIKTSYAYLFFDQLNNNQNLSKNAPSYLSTDRDVQTQDIYTAASDLLIKLLYAEQKKKQQSILEGNLEQNQQVGDADLTIDRSYAPTNMTFDIDALKTIQTSTTPLNEADAPLIKLLTFRFFDPKQTSEQDQDQDQDGVTQATNKKSTAHINVYFPNEPEYLKVNQDFAQIADDRASATNSQTLITSSIEALYASHDLNFSGLNSISKRQGIGVSYVSLLNDRQTASIQALLGAGRERLNAKEPVKRIHRTGNLLLSGVVIPQGNTLSELFLQNKYDVKLYNPYRTESINILGKPYYLSANFSASYGLWLAENQLSNVSYFSLLAQQQALTLPQLFMLEPYDPNKRIIIMLHGLASSPATWVSVTNDIFNDQTLRENYQVWQIFYPTNVPILENRYQIQTLIETAYAENDPSGRHQASSHSVLIGHSMGALISRMMLSNDNLESRLSVLQTDTQSRELSKLIRAQLSEQTVQSRFNLQKLPQIDAAVFLSAPFRGTDFADRWFTRALRRVIQLPLGFVQTIKGNLTHIATEGELTANPLGALYLQNGASQLSDKSSFIKLTGDISIDDSVTYHSIIANNDPDLAQGIAKLQDNDALVDLSDANLPDNAINDDSVLVPELSNTDELDTNALDSDTLENDSVNDEVSLDVPESDKTTAPLNENKDSIVNDQTIAKNEAVETVDGDTPTLDTEPKKISTVSSIEVVDKLSEDIATKLSDGVVPYASAHLDGAASETIITSGHSVQETPQAVLTLRKILRNHLKKYPLEKNKIKH